MEEDDQTYMEAFIAELDTEVGVPMNYLVVELLRTKLVSMMVKDVWGTKLVAITVVDVRGAKLMGIICRKFLGPLD